MKIIPTSKFKNKNNTHKLYAKPRGFRTNFKIAYRRFFHGFWVCSIRAQIPEPWAYRNLSI